jgi:MoxR-like ATPase
VVDQTFRKLVEQVEQVIQGKRDAVRLALVCLFAQGHLLIEDVPGVGKTSLAKAIAASVGGTWQRIQFTPDLLPSDVTGVSIWNRADERFEFRPGAVFATVLLADEINRASPKTQSALLEAMEEGQVTVDGHSHPLGPPFMVIATQNPIELEGTYPLPEAQLDRFLMRIAMGYPDREAENEILAADRDHQAATDLAPVITADELVALSAQAAQIHVAPALRDYIVALVAATRTHPALALGASPRGALGLQRAARAWAGANGRDFVLPDDVKLLAVPVLAHRLLRSGEAELRGVTGADVVNELLAALPVPGGAG